jgi:hypothetical protein
MLRLIKTNKEGVASVFGTVLILLLVLTLASILFLSLASYGEKAQESIDFEEERTQEKISLISLSTDNSSGPEYLDRIMVSNLGTITTRIRAIYIDKTFICDPTDPSLNPFDTYINPKDSLNIKLPNSLPYEPFSKIEVATERGIKAIEYEGILRGGNQTDPPSDIMKIYFGPLLLDFDKFYYTEVFSDGSYDPQFWQPGWSIEKGLRVVWNITVTNIDDRNITLNNYSTFTLVKNAEGGQRAYYIEFPDDQETLLIPSNTTANLIYIWDGPSDDNFPNPFNPPSKKPEECRIFMGFHGLFHEKDGSTKPYGQTIPFEAVLIRDVQMVLTADPPIIAAGSSMYSTISILVTDEVGNPKPNEAVKFSTDLGTLNSSEATTNSSGIAQVRLYPGVISETAQIIANWTSMLKATSVIIDPGELVVSLDPILIGAGGMSSLVTATVTLDGSPVLGETVSFSTNASGTQGSLSASSGLTDGSGVATVSFTSGIDTGNVSITADWGTLTRTENLIINP